MNIPYEPLIKDYKRKGTNLEEKVTLYLTVLQNREEDEEEGGLLFCCVCVRERVIYMCGCDSIG